MTRRKGENNNKRDHPSRSLPTRQLGNLATPQVLKAILRRSGEFWSSLFMFSSASSSVTRIWSMDWASLGATTLRSSRNAFKTQTGLVPLKHPATTPSSQELRLTSLTSESAFADSWTSCWLVLSKKLLACPPNVLNKVATLPVYYSNSQVGIKQGNYWDAPGLEHQRVILVEQWSILENPEDPDRRYQFDWQCSRCFVPVSAGFSLINSGHLVTAFTWVFKSAVATLRFSASEMALSSMLSRICKSSMIFVEVKVPRTELIGLAKMAMAYIPLEYCMLRKRYVWRVWYGAGLWEDLKELVAEGKENGVLFPKVARSLLCVPPMSRAKRPSTTAFHSVFPFLETRCSKKSLYTSGNVG